MIADVAAMVGVAVAVCEGPFGVRRFQMNRRDGEHHGLVGILGSYARRVWHSI